MKVPAATLVLRLAPWSASAFLLALVCVAAAAALRVAFASFGATLYFATFFPAVLIVSLFAGTPAAIAATFLANIVVWWAFVPPYMAFGPLSTTDYFNFALFWLSTSVMMWISSLYRKSVADLLHAEDQLEFKTRELSDANRQLQESQTIYRTALAAGRLGTWKTDLIAKTRLWTPEGMALFGLNLPGGCGHVGGDRDEYWSALHPDDRHLVQKFHEIADHQNSFTSEYRVIWRDGTILWLRGHGQVVTRTPDGRAHLLVSIVADVTERKAAEDHAQFLMRELSHRSKNLLAVIQSISRRTARTATTIQEYEIRFGRRLQGLAASHDVLIRNSWQGAPLADLLRQQLVLFLDSQSSRVELTGPNVVITPEATQMIGLAIHELATNAIKYGAFSVPAGEVKISWEFDSQLTRSSKLLLKWVEQGGPPVVPPSRNGFGSIVVGELIKRSLNAEVNLQFVEQGLEWSAAIPATNLLFEASDGTEPVS